MDKETEDLNLDNYSAKDLFRVFHLDFSKPLDEQQMKQAKQMVLKSHPDKSNLPSKYYLFFSDAFHLLTSIYEITKKKTNGPSPTNYQQIVSENKINAVTGATNPVNKSFSQWFNLAFEKEYTADDEESKGYAEWLASTSSTSTPTTMQEHDLELYKTKLQQQQQQHHNNQLIKQTNTNVSSSSSLIQGKKWDFNAPQEMILFTAELHGSLTFTDLKQAYEESVIPVTSADFERIPTYSSVNEYLAKRSTEEKTFTHTNMNMEGNSTNNSATLMKFLQELNF